jgi:hypothetical protein
MINFYHCFLPGVARVLQPLTPALTGNPEVLSWLTDMDDTFATAKAALIAAVPQAHPLPGAVLSLATDASDTHILTVIQ